MTTSYNGLLEPQFDEGISLAEWKTKEEIPNLMNNAFENIKLLLEETVLQWSKSERNRGPAGCNLPHLK